MTMRYDRDRYGEIPPPPKPPPPPPLRIIREWGGETPESKLLRKVWQISNRLRNYDVYNELIKELSK